MRHLEKMPAFIETQPLKITAHLATPPVFYEGLPLDSLLSYSVVQNETGGIGLPESTQPYEINLPLATLWHCPETGLPLWDATQFFPVGENTAQPALWHKRGYKPHLLKKKRNGTPHNARFREGRHKEYRMPLPLQSCLQWEAYCRGNKKAITENIKCIHSIGKKRTQGFGRIASWEINDTRDDYPYWHNGKMIKSFPVDGYIPKIPADIIFSRYTRGWTPPYWLETAWTTCIC